MPYDSRSFDEEDEASPESTGKRRRFREFECPECAAYNPLDDGFGDGDEVLCNYCGQELRVQVSEEGRLKLRLM